MPLRTLRAVPRIRLYPSAVLRCDSRPALAPAVFVGVSVIARAAGSAAKPGAPAAPGFMSLQLRLVGVERPARSWVSAAKGAAAPPLRVQREMLALRRLKTDFDLVVTAAAWETEGGGRERVGGWLVGRWKIARENARAHERASERRARERARVRARERELRV
jgi:hypothetical protein